jgi:hypothetical protein
LLSPSLRENTGCVLILRMWLIWEHQVFANNYTEECLLAALKLSEFFFEDCHGQLSSTGASYGIVTQITNHMPKS